MREAHSVCRFCNGTCGMILTIDDNEHIVQVRGDRSYPLSKGYACIKGLQAPEAMYSPGRLLHPMKRMPGGSFVQIDLETALDEIAAKLRVILDEDGGEAVGIFKGTQSYLTAFFPYLFFDFLNAIKSPNMYTTLTIDQSAHMVTALRMGRWDTGRPIFEDCDVMMMVGQNPLVSVSGGGLGADPTKRLKAAKARGMKLIVIDPRETELAQQADCFLQLKPGEDPTVAAGLIRIILSQGWQDQAFCDRYVEPLEGLREAVDGFTPEYVEARAGVPAEQLWRAAEMFACEAKRGYMSCGTGSSMSPRSNLADHLLECLNVLCGRMMREGDPVRNPGVLSPHREFRAEVIRPDRSWEREPRTKSGYGSMYGEMMSGALADELLREGEGRLRALIVNGSNPAVALPNQRKAVAGLKALDLLVAIEPYMTATAKLCDYILPPKLQYEREDVLIGPALELPLIRAPFGHYLPPVVSPPPGSDLVDDWYVYWALARRLELPLSFAGVSLDMTVVPTTEDMLRIVLRDANVPFDELRRHPKGATFDLPQQYVLSPRPEATARFAIGPEDVLAELAEVFAESVIEAADSDSEFTHLLTVRRMRGVMNSLGRSFSDARKRYPYNPLYIHPEDMKALKLTSGDMVEVISEAGRIPAIAQPDETMRRGCASMTHCWGGLPEDDDPYEEIGACTSVLVSTDKQIEPINAMPVLSAIPIRILRATAQHAETDAAVGRSFESAN